MTHPDRPYQPADPAHPLELVAGPASVVIASGAVRWIRALGTETVRGIYGAVRDPSWGTIEPVFSSYEIARDNDAFDVRFRAECVRDVDGIDFAWTGTITGHPDGTIRFVFDGVARAPFMTPRIGLCVLHPLLLAGETVEVEALFGRTRGRFPDLVTEYLPFSNVTQMRHDLGRRHETRIEFSGDAFQMEDQRAFTDASFKTFSRPLELAQPFKVDAGTVVRQMVTVALPRIAGPGRRPARIERPDRPSVVRVGAAAGHLFPAIGSCEAPPDVVADLAVAQAVRDLGLAHLRATILAADEGAAAALDRAAAAAVQAGAALELVLVATPTDAALDDLVARLAGTGVRVARCVPIDPARHTMSPALASRVRESMRARGVTAPLAGGSRGYLYQLVSEGVPASLVDEVAYPTNPQVHASDEASIVETIATLPVTVRTASALVGGKPVVVGPVSLKALFNPHQVGPELPPLPGALPARYDRRQVTSFAAAWTLGCAAALANAGAASLTLHEAAGWAGLVASAQVGLPAMPAKVGAVLPVGRVVEVLATLASTELLFAEVAEPLHAAAVRWTDGRFRVVVANLGPRLQSLAVVAGRWPADVSAVAMLELTDDGGASWRPADLVGGGIQLPPTGVVVIDARPISRP